MMEKAYRAIGQIEGVALLQGEILRDLLMGAVDVIEDAMKEQEAKVAALEKTATEQNRFVDYLLRQKDELLTENARLREQVEGRGLDTPSALRATSPIVGEEGTSPALRATSLQGEAGERIAASGHEAPPRNDSEGVKLDAENGCDYCKKRGFLQRDARIESISRRVKELIYSLTALGDLCKRKMLARRRLAAL